jgi:YD repeat-containing protein
VNDKLLSVVTNGKTKHFEYDDWGNLSKTVFEDGKTELQNPDKTGNLFERFDRLDRKYTKGGQLLKTENWEYKYDRDGNVPLHEKTETRTPDYSTEKGYFDNVRTEPVVTWVFEEGTFVPVAKITEKE